MNNSLVKAKLVLDEEGHVQDGFEATYSAEDDKLRIYYPYRSDKPIYDLFVAMGFKSAPKQECLFAKWSPRRADFCLLVCEGEIEAEGTTMAERAEAKASRLSDYQDSRLKDANRFQKAASSYSERFAYGQPILTGHHSEKGARRDKKRADSAMEQAVKNTKTANYWGFRIAGVERHAERKNSPAVRSRRIKTLLKELRDHQKIINRCNFALETWGKALSIKDDAERLAFITNCVNRHYGDIAPYEAFNDLESGKIAGDELAKQCFEHHTKICESGYQTRWVEHVLNRLGYETEMLGQVDQHQGELTPVILKRFLRVFGAESPNINRAEDGGFTATSPVDFPLFIADGKKVTLSCVEWVELMQDLGHSVAANTPKKTTTPLLNIDTDSHVRKSLYTEKTQELGVLRMTKAEYNITHPDDRGVITSLCGQYRFRTVFVRSTGSHFSGVRSAVYLTDSKAHPKPEVQA